MCRALGHIHTMGICHRDIKPQNLLVDTRTHQLKLCDFGSAKVQAHYCQCYAQPARDGGRERERGGMFVRMRLSAQHALLPALLIRLCTLLCLTQAGCRQQRRAAIREDLHRKQLLMLWGAG